MPRPMRNGNAGISFTAADTPEKKSSSPGTRGYPEPQPRRNDEHELPDRHTPHEHQNKPKQNPKPSGH